MENIREQFTLDDRAQLQVDICELRPYLLPLLLKRQGGVCRACGAPASSYDIDHTIYNPRVSINELQALCIPCHKEKTDFRPLRNR